MVLCHGLSATRRYVLHGSTALARRGYRVVTYDARGHGVSDPAGDGYDYARLTHDLERVIDSQCADGPLVVGGHSMGSHTAASWALANPARLAALILIGPVYVGESRRSDLHEWERRARVLEQEGPEAYGLVAAEGFDDEGAAATAERLARDRAGLHRRRDAVAEALRQVPVSSPFDRIVDLGQVTAPALVIASHDRFDPGHPYEVASRYADALGSATLVSEDDDEPPLAWRGSRLSRVIADFLEQHGIGPGPPSAGGPADPDR
ncbi:MAG: alpha/beta fold hydrolase [Solirubrobacterales bacterium]|nr:alpha/beta fold hydrolase [Solirubrobacterales bacterium]